MRHAHAPSACHNVAKLRTSVANDEIQTQGDSAGRVDEHSRRVDNDPRRGHLAVKVFLNEARTEGLPNLRKGRDYES